MKPARFIELVVQSLTRNRRHFLLSGIGVVIGIATLFFFTGLGEGVRTTVLEDVFVIDQLEVVDPAARAGGLFGASGLTDRNVREVEALPGVAAVYPKMKLTFPSRGSGGEALVGRDLGIEFIADGIPAELVAPTIRDEHEFRDHHAPVSCQADDDCRAGFECGDDQCQPLSCDPRQLHSESPCQGGAYCHRQRRECAIPIPLVISPYLLEVYNGSVHTALRDAEGIGGNLPRLSRDMLVGFEFDIVFGESFMGRTGGVDSRRERARIVGFSDWAMQLGATMPLDYVIRLNKEFSGQEMGETYHSLLIEAQRNEDVARIAQAVEDDLGLQLSDRHQQAERAGLLILMLTLLFNLIAIIILAVAAINITHTFSMVIMERRREIGLMRALGATRRQIQALVVGEATVVGLAAGLTGIAVGMGAAMIVDVAFDRYVGEFPFKPESLFAWSPWMFALALGTAILFCLIGALFPARRAGKVDPARALTGR